MEKIAADYEILPVGAAIGDGVGPVLVGNLKPGARIALPGENTTAQRLCHFWLQSTQNQNAFTLVQMPFYDMLPALYTGKVDAAVLIHEGRFVYEARGLTLIEDLGHFWQEQTGSMVPLGCIYAHRNLPASQKDSFVNGLRNSITRSQQEYRDKSAVFLQEMMPHMQRLAQENDPEVIQAHIDTYVTSDTIEPGSKSLKSIDVFRQRCLL
jgi:1,4-dihydroxy-6-naphthoate synthase